MRDTLDAKNFVLPDIRRYEITAARPGEAVHKLQACRHLLNFDCWRVLNHNLLIYGMRQFDVVLDALDATYLFGDLFGLVLLFFFFDLAA